MNLYPLCVAVGIGLAAWASARQPVTLGISPDQRTSLALAAVVGAILGAYLLQWPADWLSAPADIPLGGRTVLGGLIGGWLTVEAVKWKLGVHVASGDGFALPLALALTCGRLGCLSAGCCAGVVCTPAWWTLGVPRVPTQLIEVVFHGTAALVLWWAARRHLAGGQRLAIYLTAYATLRFGLEFVREHPRVGPLTWHQGLALILFAIAATTWWRRSTALPNA